MKEHINAEPDSITVNKIIQEVMHRQKSCSSSYDVIYKLDEPSDFNILSMKISNLSGIVIKDYHILFDGKIIVTMKILPIGLEGIS